MSLSNQDRVCEKSTTTGTGTYTLGGVPDITGYKANDVDTFASVADGNTVIYCAVGVDPTTGIPNNTGWEVGLGTYTASGTTLARTTIYRSTNANAAVNWGAGTRFIFSTFASEGTHVIRQPGGTVGTDEVQIYHDGTDGYIRPKSGQLMLAGEGGDIRTDNVSYIRASGTTYLTQRIGVQQTCIAGEVAQAHIGFGSAPYGSPDVAFFSPVAGVMRVSDGSTGTGWLQQGAGRSRVNSNVTNNSTTMANITGLSATLIAGRKYTGKLVCYVAEATAADGIKLDFDGGTATMTSFRAHATIFDTALLLSSQVSALATDFVVATITGDSLVTIDFAFVCNAAGTFIPRAAKNSDAAGANLTVYANSFMWVEDMP